MANWRETPYNHDLALLFRDCRRSVDMSLKDVAAIVPACPKCGASMIQDEDEWSSKLLDTFWYCMDCDHVKAQKARTDE